MNHAPAFLKLVDDAKKRIRETTPDSVRKWLEARNVFALIDVREESEWIQGHLPSAMHLCKGIIERDIENAIPAKATPIVLYCGGGYRSALAADNLQKMGYTNVVSLEGGWRAWTDAGFPTVKD